jgi:hypothetical protein
MAENTSKITVTNNPGDGYEMTLTITGTMNPFQDGKAVVRELLDLAAQAAFPLLRGDFDERVMDVLEPKFRDREIRASAPSEFDLGYEAGRKAGVAAAAVEATGLTVDELRALPKGAVVLDSVGDAWESEGGDRWVWTNPHDPQRDVATLGSEALHHDWSPLHQRTAENSNEE